MSRKLLWIGLAALAIRLLYLYLNQRPLVSDEVDYQNLAVNLATQFRYTTDSVPTAYRPVGYPAFIAFIYFIAGIKPIVMKIVQAMLDSSIVFLLPRLMEDASKKAKLLAALAWSLFPPAIVYPNMLLSESVYTVILVITAVAFVSKRPGVARQIVLGVALGILALMKPATILFLFAVVVIDLAFTKAWRPSIIVLASFALVVFPWTIRNWTVMGEPVIATNSGINLLIGNNPSANGSYTSKVALLEADSSADEASRDRFAFRKAVTFMVSNPATFVVNALKKYAYFFSSESFLLVTQFGTEPSDWTIPLARRYAAIPLPATFLVNGFYAIVLISGWLGLLASAKNRIWYFAVALLSSFLCIHLVTFGGSRFHFPLMPFFVIFAVEALMEWKRHFGALPRTRKIAFVFGVLSVVSVWGLEALIVVRS